MKKMIMALVLCLVSIVGISQNVEPAQPAAQPEEQPALVQSSALGVTERSVTPAELQLSISQLNERYGKEMEEMRKQMQSGGFHLEKAGRQFIGAIAVSGLGLAAGLPLFLQRQNLPSIVGFSIISAAEVTSLVLVICGIHNMKESGLVFQGNGVVYRF